jgi:SagB-type dehydrogenase family enzyme
MLPSDDPQTLSLLFHLNSEPWLNEDAYRAGSYHHEFKQFPDAAGRVMLPPPPPGGLSRLIGTRKSARHYERQTLPLASLSALLSSAYGVVEISPLETGGAFLRRSVPSGGGLYPLEVYLFLKRVSELKDGLYHYDAVSHALELISAGDKWDILSAGFYTFPFIENANLVFCLAADFGRMQKKYGPRGYRYILLEAGHVAQNVCLAATELGLGSLCMGGFKDSVVNSSLGLRPRDEGLVYAVAVGC